MAKFVKVGQKAPNFNVDSINMGPLSLSKYLEKAKYTLVIFSRYWGCPVCQFEFQEILDAREKFQEAGIQLVYINQSSVKSGKDFLESKPTIWFPVVSTNIIEGTKHDYEIFDSYGVGSLGVSALAGIAKKALQAKKKGYSHGDYEGFERQSPAQVLVGQDGTIVYARKGMLDLEKLFEVTR